MENITKKIQDIIKKQNREDKYCDIESFCYNETNEHISIYYNNMILQVELRDIRIKFEKIGYILNSIEISHDKRIFMLFRKKV